MKGLSSERTLSAKEQAELEQKVAAVGRKELAKLDAKTRLQLQQSTDAIAHDVGTRLASDGAAGFDALTDVLQQRNDAMMDQYRNKRAEAAANNGGMWQQTKADIAAIDATVAANKQQRAVQAAQIQQRYDQRTMDFRMANPAYRRPEPLFSYDSALAADNAMWSEGKTRVASINRGLEFTKQVAGLVFEPDNLAQIGFIAGDDLALNGFKLGDQLITGIIDGATLVTDPGAIFDLQARTDQVVRQGYLPKGEKLSYRMGKEIYDRGLDNFVLRLDARVLEPLGPMVSPLPFNFDDLKVHGSVNTKGGKILDGAYDFIDPKTGTLEQRTDPKAKPWVKALTYARNQLNKIAFSQHSPTGKPYEIEYMYTDNDLIYGRNNYAPWKPDVDPSYARPYEWYLNYHAAKRNK